MEDPSRSLDVLVVEDNPVNQKVVVGLLTKWGHRVIVACDGASGLEALQRQDVDLVLMDIQMPMMDGIEATCSIRARERAHGGYTPIIAVTAHATTQDRARCLEAGADRYLTKPINSKLLRKTIAELFPAAPHEPDAPPATVIGGEVDFDQLKASVGEDPVLMAEVIEIFFHEAHVTLENAARAISQWDSPALEASAHRLKGSLSTVGAAGAAQTANLLESMGRDGALVGAAELCERLRLQVDAACESLRLWKDQPTA